MSILTKPIISDFYLGPGKKGRSFSKNFYLQALSLRTHFIEENGGRPLDLIDIVEAQIAAPLDSTIWNCSLEASEEYRGFIKTGPVRVVVHGAGLLSNMEWIVDARNRRANLTFLREDGENLVNGMLPDRRPFPVYQYADFVKMPKLDLPYAVIVPAVSGLLAPGLISPQDGASSVVNVEVLDKDPLYVARVGGLENAAKHISALKHAGINYFINEGVPFTDWNDMYSSGNWLCHLVLFASVLKEISARAQMVTWDVDTCKSCACVLPSAPPVSPAKAPNLSQIVETARKYIPKEKQDEFKRDLQRNIFEVVRKYIPDSKYDYFREELFKKTPESQ